MKDQKLTEGELTDGRRTNCSDWDEYISTPFNRDPSSTFQLWYDQYLPVNPDWTVIEIGACPGNHLAALVKSHKYKPAALDFHPSVHELKSSFADAGFPGLQTIHADFFTMETDQRFDVVMSLGFIEHFEDVADCLARHWRLVKEGGYLFIGLPIMGPLQMLLRYLVLAPDQLERALRIHNRKIMDMKLLRRIMYSLGSAEVVFCDYVRQMDNWFEGTEGLRPRSRWVFPVWNVAARIPKAFDYSCHFYSPYGILVARKSPSAS